jgi:hypothetical protein
LCGNSADKEKPMFQNIEKSAFHKGEYVGYGSGLVWRILRHGGNYWGAQSGSKYIQARTLKMISQQIQKLA